MSVCSCTADTEILRSSVLQNTRQVQLVKMSVLVKPAFILRAVVVILKYKDYTLNKQYCVITKLTETNKSICSSINLKSCVASVSLTLTHFHCLHPHSDSFGHHLLLVVIMRAAPHYQPRVSCPPLNWLMITNTFKTMQTTKSKTPLEPNWNFHMSSYEPAALHFL